MRAMTHRFVSALVTLAVTALVALGLTSASPQASIGGEIGVTIRHCWSSWQTASPDHPAVSGGISASKNPAPGGGSPGTVRVRTCSGCESHTAHSEVEVSSCGATVTGLDKGDTVKIENASVSLTGNDAHVEIKGNAQVIDVTGNGNDVDLDPNATVTVNITGNENDIDLNESNSQVTASGSNNHVHN
jgi:hypothetical protein